MTDIQQLDADFDKLLANPGGTPQEVASCIAARYAPVLERFSYALLAGLCLPGSVKADRTEEAVQQVLADQTGKVLAGKFTFRGNSRYSTYLHTILRRTLRRLANASSRTVSLEGSRTTADPRSPDPHTAALRSLILDRFAECSARLSRVQRQFLARVLVGEQSIKDAGLELGFKNPGYQWKLLLDKLKAESGGGLENLYRAYVGERDKHLE